jgi:hypothetical protein
MFRRQDSAQVMVGSKVPSAMRMKLWSRRGGALERLDSLRKEDISMAILREKMCSRCTLDSCTLHAPGENRAISCVFVCIVMSKCTFL